MSDLTPGPQDFALEPADLERFCEYLYRRTGMTFGESKRYYIDRRVADRMQAVEIKDFPAYFALMRNSAHELDAVISAFAVNETYFFRELHQFECLTRALLPEVIADKGPGDRVRLWSLPCSTGDEAYSMAIWLLEHWPLVDAYNVEIVGSDIDIIALEQARAGRFSDRALSRLPAELVNGYFGAHVGGGRRIIDDLRESVTFTPANLIERSTLATQGTFDVIFCRNVLIYFDDAARRTAAENLYDCLKPGGFLCLGHTESMTRIDDRFETRRLDDAVVYQRPKGRR